MFDKKTYSTFEVALNHGIAAAFSEKKAVHIVAENNAFVLQLNAPAFGVVHFRLVCDESGAWACFHVQLSDSILCRRRFASGIDEIIARLGNKRLINNESLWGAR